MYDTNYCEKNQENFPMGSFDRRKFTQNKLEEGLNYEIDDSAKNDKKKVQHGAGGRVYNFLRSIKGKIFLNELMNEYDCQIKEKTINFKKTININVVMESMSKMKEKCEALIYYEKMSESLCIRYENFDKFKNVKNPQILRFNISKRQNKQCLNEVLKKILKWCHSNSIESIGISQMGCEQCFGLRSDRLAHIFYQEITNFNFYPIPFIQEIFIVCNTGDYAKYNKLREIDRRCTIFTITAKSQERVDNVVNELKQLRESTIIEEMIIPEYCELDSLEEFENENTRVKIMGFKSKRKIVLVGMGDEAKKTWQLLTLFIQNTLKDLRSSFTHKSLTSVSNLQDRLSIRLELNERVPHNWTKFKGNLKDIFSIEPYIVDLYEKDKRQFDEIKNFFLKAWKYSDGLNSKIHILSIKMNENPCLFESHSTALDEYLTIDMESHLTQELNEHYLFHGTSEISAKYILHQGFDYRLANRGNFGKGIYFAENPKKSHAFTECSEKKTMLISRVLLGNSIYLKTSERDLERPPCAVCKASLCEYHNQIYDSVIGLFKDKEMVIYDPFQCYPEYLLTYKIVWI
ncbi:DgyrCDS11739 [Dimorphilus gyrociliatus]|uniref:Poly [ADP-ribose] polymerase n=1 Tax=Dimorphilus gyrociliatus TaxID=2664684 RepID=A0A7I8W497_9ANNE|nr:DgyrCDS11739 [Dimorphilus gyrociliatus]